MKLLKIKTGRLSVSKFFFFLRGYSKQMLQVFFSVLCIFFIWWFFRHENTELKQVPEMLRKAQPIWLFSGLLLAVIYIFIQALMYRAAFHAANATVGIFDMTILFLKRNFASVFLPAGGISSLAFFGQSLEKQGINRSVIHTASILYGFAGIASIVLVAVPAFVGAIFYISLGWASWLSLLLAIVLVTGIFIAYRSIERGGRLKLWLQSKFPTLQILLDEIQNNHLHRKYVLTTIGYSILIEFCGIAHLYIAMKALGGNAILFAAVIGYVVAVIFMLISPFMRGLGAVELSMVYLLTRFGISHDAALSVTILYRAFEFWFPLGMGIVAFYIRWNKIILRLLPAFLLSMSGIVNILSVLTPAIESRLALLRNFIPLDISHASNVLVFATGVFMMATSLYLLKGLRRAWILACILCIISITGNLLKAYDYEEATISAIVLFSLILTRKQYILKSYYSWEKDGRIGIIWLLTGIGFTLLYGTVGFYLIDEIHFMKDFNLYEGLLNTIRTICFLGNNFTHTDEFAYLFLRSVQLLGFSCYIYLVYLVFTPWITRSYQQQVNLRTWALQLTQQYGDSSMDYFKYYPDKLIFKSESEKAFISFKTSGIYAIVLGTPVAVTHNERLKCIREFEDYCQSSGFLAVYYRVNVNELYLFKDLKKKQFFLGQEAIVNLSKFSLEGKEKKSLRNAINKLKSSDFTLKIYQAPLSTELVDQLEEVSSIWLNENKREEILFAEGIFIKEEITSLDVITLEHINDNEVLAFLNIIPDYAAEEGTYDLIRKKQKAPNGSMDALLIEMFHYFQNKGIQYANLGMVPMSGLNKAQNLGEQLIKLAYEHNPQFAHYKGLREFKEKFDPSWQNVYLIYTEDFHLLTIPKALKDVMSR